MTFHVSNLSPDTSREDLLKAFQAHGEVESVNLPADRMSGGASHGVHRGYAFVVMRDKREAHAAQKALDGKPIHGAAVSVRVARPRWTPSYIS